MQTLCKLKTHQKITLFQKLHCRAGARVSLFNGLKSENYMRESKVNKQVLCILKVKWLGPSQIPRILQVNMRWQGHLGTMWVQFHPHEIRKQKTSRKQLRNRPRARILSATLGESTNFSAYKTRAKVQILHFCNTPRVKMRFFATQRISRARAKIRVKRGGPQDEHLEGHFAGGHSVQQL